jgi:Fic family protein
LDAILFFKDKGVITGLEYAKRYNITDRMARNDLSELIEKNLLEKQGETKSVKYLIKR